MKQAECVSECAESGVGAGGGGEDRGEAGEDTVEGGEILV